MAVDGQTKPPTRNRSWSDSQPFNGYTPHGCAEVVQGALRVVARVEQRHEEVVGVQGIEHAMVRVEHPLGQENGRLVPPVHLCGVMERV